jgi:hypothetical protein
MSHTIFFSWQNDTPRGCGKDFIEAALEAALDGLFEDTPDVEPAVRDAEITLDRDTKGEPGTPPIVDTIFKKIDKAAIFVADMTFVAQRPDGNGESPNPNVLIEYGWALRALTHERMLPVMNTAYGEPTPQGMPFDMRHLGGLLTYNLPADYDRPTRKAKFKELVKELRKRMVLIFQSEGFRASMPKPPQPAKFRELAAQFGAARFRAQGEPLGVLDGGFLGWGQHGKDVTLFENPAMWLRVMPDLAVGKSWLVGELREVVTRIGSMLLPVGSETFRNFYHVRSHDGFGWTAVWSDDPTKTPAVAFAFTTGEIWSLNVAPFIEEHAYIPYVEAPYIGAFKRYVNCLGSQLKIAGPYRWYAGIEKTKGRYFMRMSAPGRAYAEPRAGPCTAQYIMADGVFTEGQEMHLALNRFFERIYDACGAQRPPELDEVLKQVVDAP